MKTLYDLLGVDHEATLADIAHNYRYLLSEQILRHGNQPMRRRDRMRLQKLREAFLLLSSPARRQAYDEQLQALRNARYRAVGAAKTALGALLLIAGLSLLGTSSWTWLRHSGNPVGSSAEARNRTAPGSEKLVSAEQAKKDNTIVRND